MKHLSFQNHFKFGYDKQPFSFRISAQQKWFVEYGKCQTEPLTFYDECLRTARIIKENTTEKIWILFSGGVDSEVALRSFVMQKIPIKVAILRFKNDLNIHDIAHAVVVCEQLGIEYTFFDLDITSFWEKEGLKYASATQCISPFLLSTMWLVDQIDGFPILGSGECLLVKRVPSTYIPGVSPYLNSEWDLWEKEKIAAWYRHFIVTDREGCPGFFQYTPEIICSYIQDSYVQKLINNQIAGKLSTESSKLKIYQQHFQIFDRKKYTGFEKVEAESKPLRTYLENLFPHHNEIVKSECNLLLSQSRINLPEKGFAKQEEDRYFERHRNFTI